MKLKVLEKEQEINRARARDGEDEDCDNGKEWIRGMGGRVSVVWLCGGDGGALGGKL